MFNKIKSIFRSRTPPKQTVKHLQKRFLISEVLLPVCILDPDKPVEINYSDPACMHFELSDSAAKERRKPPGRVVNVDSTDKSELIITIFCFL